MEEKIIIGRQREEPEAPKRRPPWFWWALVNASAACLAVLTWAVCLHVFNQPEKPENYRILERIGRTPELKPFTARDAPQGAQANPQTLYRKFATLDEHQLARLNPRLLRNYLQNFGQPLLNTYVEGGFRIVKVRPLTAKDIFHPGIAVRARAETRNGTLRKPAPYPVWVDFLFPASAPGAIRQFAPGQRLSVKKIPNCVAVLRIDHFTLDEEPQILLTATPIAYGTYTDKENRRISIAPPPRIRPGAPLPVFPPPGK